MVEGPTRRLVVGRFGGPYGVKGEAKLASFTDDPMTLADLPDLETAHGPVRLLSARILKGATLAVRVADAGTREAVAAFQGLEVTAPRTALPALDDPDEVYVEDLKGLAAFTPDGRSLGQIFAVHDFGAGPLIELRDIPDVKGSRLVPFTKAACPDVDLAAARIVIDPPPGLFD